MDGKEEVKHEEYKYEAKADKVIQMPSADTEVRAAGYPEYMNQEAMMQLILSLVILMILNTFLKLPRKII